jgi:hypothetical protein
MRFGHPDCLGGLAAMNILLVSPQTPMTFWSLKHAVRFMARRAAFPPLGLLTVAAMLPRSWNIRLVDMDVQRLRDADLQWADYVLIGAMIVHKQSIEEEIIPRCKRLGRTIIGGGPLFTTYVWPFEVVSVLTDGHGHVVLMLRSRYERADRGKGVGEDGIDHRAPPG